MTRIRKRVKDKLRYKSRKERWNELKKHFQIVDEPWDFKFVSANRRKEAIKQLRIRDGDNCWLCGTPVPYDAAQNTFHYPSIDHVIPFAEGGCDCMANLRLAHKGCNERRHGSDIPRTKGSS
jgi:5-methylcytosine-specific restriction endonuclease McrA